MKILVFATFAVLFAARAHAVDGLYFQCSDGKVMATLNISAQSARTKSSTNECNMGVGDEPTGCHEVVNFYEDKRAIVFYRSGSQSIKKAFRVRRWSPEDRGYDPRRPLFSGATEVQVSAEITDQISVGERPTNPLAYSLNVIRFTGNGPSARNLGRVSLLCHIH